MQTCCPTDCQPFFPQVTCWHLERLKSWLNSISLLQFQSPCIVHTWWGLDKCRNRRVFSSASSVGTLLPLTRSMCWPGGWGQVAPAQLGELEQWKSEVESQHRDKIRLFGLKVCDYCASYYGTWFILFLLFLLSTSCVTVECRFHFSLMNSAAPLISFLPRHLPLNIPHTTSAVWELGNLYLWPWRLKISRLAKWSKAEDDLEDIVWLVFTLKTETKHAKRMPPFNTTKLSHMCCKRYWYKFRTSTKFSETSLSHGFSAAPISVRSVGPVVAGIEAVVVILSQLLVLLPRPLVLLCGDRTVLKWANGRTSWIPIWNTEDNLKTSEKRFKIYGCSRVYLDELFDSHCHDYLNT